MNGAATLVPISVQYARSQGAIPVQRVVGYLYLFLQYCSKGNDGEGEDDHEQ